MSNPCEFCQGNLKFIRKINGNYMHSMVIPEWFANYFRGKIPGIVKLETRNGITYDVSVTENMNRTILKSGWAAFVDANQIEENYSLMFRYIGNARFEVTIFDSNGREIALWCAGMKTASDVNTPNSHYVGNSSSSRHGTTQSLSGEGSDSDGCPKESSFRYRKSSKMPTLSYTSEEFSEEDNPSLDDSVESDDRQVLSDDYFLSGRCHLTEAHKLEIQALVKKIQPEVPMLVVVMKKSNLIQNGRLEIHWVYALKYFPCEDTNIILQLPGKNKNWKCKFHIRPPGVSGAGRRNLSFSEFVCDNNVREGDICLFQPMNNPKQRRFTVTVHLLRKARIDHLHGERTGIGSNHGRTSTKMAGTKEEPPSDGKEYSLEHEDYGVSNDDSEGSTEPPFMLAGRHCLTPAQEKKMIEKVEEIGSNLPLYVALINKSSVYKRGLGSGGSPILYFGLQYAARYLGDMFAGGRRRGKSKVISLVLQRDGRSRTWTTELCHSIRHSVHLYRIQKGWPSFARENRLRKGDLCLFKLMKNEEPLRMMVYIIRFEKS